MYFPVSHRVLTRTLMAGLLAFAGTTACSRPDRSESRDADAAVMQDTAAVQDTMTAGTGQTATGTDTMTGSGTTMGDTAPAQIQSDAPRAATASPSAERQDTSLQGDTASQGYRPMQRDTATVPVESDSARVTEDTSEIGVNPDTAAAGYVEMARDTSGAADQIDTTAGAWADTAGALQARVDTTETETELAVADSGKAITAVADTTGAVADTTGNDGRIRPPEDSTEVGGEVTTDTNTTAVAAVSGDAAVGARGADTTENAGRIRPPEDSTEILGDVNSADTADEAQVTEVAQDSLPNDPKSVAATEPSADDVGAAAIGGTVTGADAVAMMTRQGARCTVVDPESDEKVRWDMSRTPATLNPCGLGSMNLSKIVTER